MYVVIACQEGRLVGPGRDSVCLSEFSSRQACTRGRTHDQDHGEPNTFFARWGLLIAGSCGEDERAMLSQHENVATNKIRHPPDTTAFILFLDYQFTRVYRRKTYESS